MMDAPQKINSKHSLTNYAGDIKNPQQWIHKVARVRVDLSLTARVFMLEGA